MAGETRRECAMSLAQLVRETCASDDVSGAFERESARMVVALPDLLAFEDGLTFETNLEGSGFVVVQPYEGAARFGVRVNPLKQIAALVTG